MAKPTAWDDGKHTTVRRLQISYGTNLINSIKIEYDQNGSPYWGPKHGEFDGEQFDEVKLDYPDEYLISVTGYNATRNSENVVKALTVESNRRTYGPFGYPTGRYFAVTAPKSSKIVGFHGKSGTFLNFLDAYFERLVPVSSLGPYGGNGGLQWDDGMDYSGIKQIQIASGSRIHSIRVNYDDHGSSVWSDTHGGAGGEKTSIVLDYPNEYLVSVAGYYSAMSEIVVQSLTFRTNKNIYGPYGQEKGKYFSLSLPDSKIIGFHGKGGAYLNSIGAHLVPAPDTSKSVGTFGGPGGGSWDDGKHTGIKQIKIAHGSAIDSITFEYDDNGVLKWSAKHGRSGGSAETIALDYPDEFLIATAGYYSEFNGSVVLRRLRFESNKRIYGPFGPQNGKYFSFPTFSGKIVGYFGKCGDLIDSIGAHVKPIPASYKPFYVGPFGGKGGSIWNDGIYTTVRKVEIWCDSVVKSIRIEYDNNGRSKLGEKRGTDSTGKVNELKIDHPIEYVVSISGHIQTESSPVIQSLTIETNKKKHGPFGTERGTAFSLGLTGRKIVGFHGRASTFLEAIGVYTMPLPAPTPYEFLGPSGGQNGLPWDHGFFTGIRTIQITHGVLIDSFRVEYDVNGRSFWTQKQGLGGSRPSEIKLDYPNEYLTSVSGYFDSGTGRYVRSLTFESNKQTYGPFGTSWGEPFKYDTPNTMIVGFHGRSGNYIDSIGVYTVPIPNPSYPSEYFEPLGGEGGEGWDDGIYDTVRKITVGPGEYGIWHVSFEYRKNRETVAAEGHGDKPIKLFHAEIDDPGEFLISVSGYYDRVDGFNTPFIQSLKFETNKDTFGPYGVERGTPFSFDDVAGKIVGFHGSSSKFLNKIGIHTKPILD